MARGGSLLWALLVGVMLICHRAEAQPQAGTRRRNRSPAPTSSPPLVGAGPYGGRTQGCTPPNPQYFCGAGDSAGFYCVTTHYCLCPSGTRFAGRLYVYGTAILYGSVSSQFYNAIQVSTMRPVIYNVANGANIPLVNANGQQLYGSCPKDGSGNTIVGAYSSVECSYQGFTQSPYSGYSYYVQASWNVQCVRGAAVAGGEAGGPALDVQLPISGPGGDQGGPGASQVGYIPTPDACGVATCNP